MKAAQKRAWLQVASKLDDLRRLAKAASNGDEQARDELLNAVRPTCPEEVYVGKSLRLAFAEMGYEQDEKDQDGVDLSETQREIDGGSCRQTL